MRLIQYLTEKNGSYLENGKTPKENDKVYTLVGFDQKIIKGKIIRITNIDNKGLANNYMDIDDGQKKWHVSIDVVFDHKPKKIKVRDEYGETSRWV